MMNSSPSKILIVDDNSFYLTLLKTILKDVDAEVYMAGSGREALPLISQNDFALAILDIQMPEMDGFELAGHIRNMQDRDLVPIIFLTAYFSDDIQMFKGYDNGAIDYLTKPVNKAVFLSKVRIFLELDQQKRNLIQSKNSIQESKREIENKKNEIEQQNKILRKAQQEIEQSRRKYIKLYDFAPSGYLTIDRQGNILDINLRGSALLGSHPASLINKNFKSFFDPQTTCELDRFIDQVFANDTNSGCELVLAPPAGKPRYVFLEGANTDEADRCLLSMVDMTGQKEAQIALAESEELYHSLLKTSPDGIIICSLDGRITEASDIAKTILGNNRDEIEGKMFTDFLPDASKRVSLRIYKMALDAGMAQNLEINLKRSDGIEFTGEISLTQVKGNNGELKAFMVVLRDISERKLIEKQLRHSERMAGIGELATGMAHEINQPLNTISLSIDNILFALNNHTLTENYLSTKLDKVFDNITRIKKIIDHVRTFSRDQDDFVQSEFNINNSIRNSISMISEQIAEQQINLSFSPDLSVPLVKGNAYRFEQVILNMIGNAKDAIDEKWKKNSENFRKKIELSTKRNGNQIIVEIRDNGIGIEPQNIEKVLLPFFTTKVPGKGTGLGLSISYGIIKELGGEIDLQSRLNVGTSIFIKIPVKKTRKLNSYVQ
jgi:PAS domain S-box-containing protein